MIASQALAGLGGLPAVHGGSEGLGLSDEIMQGKYEVNMVKWKLQVGNWKLWRSCKLLQIGHG